MSARVRDADSGGSSQCLRQRVWLADPIKASTGAAIAEFKDQGLHIILLTGDNEKTAISVARNVGIEDVKADVMPQNIFTCDFYNEKDILSL